VQKEQYTGQVLAEFSRDKVKKLVDKYNNLKKSNDKFQGLVL